MKTRTGMRERKVMWLKFQQRSELCVSQSAIYKYSNSTDARRINRKSVWVIFCNFPPDLSKPQLSISLAPLDLMPVEISNKVEEGENCKLKIGENNKCK